MSVNTSEEYLDELLEAIEPIIRMGEPEPEDVPMPQEEIVETSVEVTNEVEPPEVNDEPLDMEETSAISELLTSLASEDEFMDESMMSEEDVESLLDAVNSQAVSEETDNSYDADVKELLKQFTEDEDLSDIQDILDKNDNGEALDNAMLDLPDVEVFQLEEDADDVDEVSDKVKKANPINKLMGGFSNLFKKRKNKKTKDVEEASTEEIFTEESTETFTDENTEKYIEPVETELGLADMDGFDLGELLETDEDELLLDEDMSDIEQLLTGGSFTEEEKLQNNDVSNEEEENSGKRKQNKKKSKNKKKESFFAKIVNALTEELDEPEKTGRKVPEAGETGVTEENLNILEELSAEDKKKAKLAKKEEKQKKKAEKKGKKGSKKGENDGTDSADKKSKKSNKPKKVEEITKPEKKLPKKRVISTLALCFSILAAVLILENVVFKADNLEEAKFAFDNGDYATCYANLETIERGEEEEDLYQKSFIILSVQRKWDAYNNFVAMNNGLEALNALLEGVATYRSQEEIALEWGVHAQIAAIYQRILEALQGYGLSQSDVDEILAYESKVTYTKRLDSIINGTPFVIEELSGSEVISQPQPLQDVLPGEEDFLPDDTTLVNEQVSVETSENEENEGQDVPSSGETVVVGSEPVNMSQQDAGISYEEPIVTGGQNVGNGSTNISSEVSGQNVVVGVR